jgi:LysM repeat protein
MKERADMDITAGNRAYRSRRTDRRRRTPRVRSGAIYSTEHQDGYAPRGLSGLELAIILALVAAVIAAALLSGPRTTATPARTSAIKVGAGQSLWSIATEHPMPGMSTQQAVDAIKRANHLEGSTIAEGSTLRVPSTPQAAVALAR